MRQQNSLIEDISSELKQPEHLQAVVLFENNPSDKNKFPEIIHKKAQNHRIAENGRHTGGHLVQPICSTKYI